MSLRYTMASGPIGSTNAPPHSLGAGSGSSNTSGPSISEQIGQVDQAIADVLRDIDRNFSRANEVVLSRILPAVRKYGVESARTWQGGAQFWKKFFETSADVSLGGASGGPEDGSQYGGYDGYDRTSETFGSEESPLQGRRARHAAGNDSTASVSVGGEDSGNDRAGGGYFGANESSPAVGPASGRDERTSWQPPAGDSPFERLRRNVARLSEDTSSAHVEQMLAATRRQHGDETASTDVQALAAQMTRGEDGKAGPSEVSTSGIPQPPQITRRAAGGGATGKSPRLLNRVLASEQRKRDSVGHLPRLVATPRGKGAAKGNPFGGALTGTDKGRWDGIADLARHTPDGKASGGGGGGGGGTRRYDAFELESESSSLGLGAYDMSPPKSMMFSVPQDRFNKTPAKEAARLIVADFLHTVNGTSPAMRRIHRHEDLLRSQRKSGIKALPARRGGGAEVGSTATPGRGEGGKRTRNRRDSMPTPPTVTKRGPVPAPSYMPRLSTNTPGGLPGALAPGSGGSGSVAKPGARSAGGGAKATMLLDEGEDDPEEDARRDEAANDQEEEEEDVPENLGTKLSALALSHDAGVVDKLFEADKNDYGDEDDDESSSSSSSSEEEEDVVAPGTIERGQWTGTSTSASGSGSRGDRGTASLDQDTLFGVPPTSSRDGSSLGPLRLHGQHVVEDMGTVYEGRPLLRQDDDTSTDTGVGAREAPTPLMGRGAIVAGQRKATGGGSGGGGGAR